MGFRPAPKGLPQTSHGYTVDFSRWPQTDLVGSGSFKEFGELATSTAQTLRIEEGGYIRSLDDTNAQYIGINPNVVGGFNGRGQFSECLCYLDATATATNYWVGPAVFIGADQQSGVTSGEHHYTLLLNDAGGGVSDWQVYRRSDGLWNGLATANGEPDVAGKHFLLRLEAYVLPDNSGVRLKCWKDGKLIIEVVDTNVDRLLGPSTVASHPAYGYPGLSWGNNGINDPSRWVKWMRGGDLPELSEPKLNLPVAHSAGPAITFVPTSGDSGVATASNTNGQNLNITIDISDGADLLIILNVAWGQTTISLEDWVTTTEPFALLDGTQVAEIFPNLGGDVAIRAYGVVNPTAKVETITATVGGDLNTNYHLMAAVAYNGVDTSSLNAAAKVRWLTNNNDSPSTTTIFPERGSANNKMLALCGALGFTSTTPTVTNDGGFTERARFASDAGVGNADGTIYIAEGGAPSPLTVTWPGSDENGGFYVELINAGNVSAALGPFLVERPWTSRPPWGTRIDMSNPLARKLKRFVMFDSGDVGYDFVQGVFGVPQANYGSNSVTKYGRAANLIQSTGTQAHEWPDEATVIKDFGTLGHTFMALARSDTSGTPVKPNQEFIAAGETAGTDDLWNYRLLTDGSPRYTIYYDNGTIANSESPYPTGKDATDWCFHGGTWDADRNEIICRIDRAQDATPGSVPGTVGVGDSSTVFSVGSNASSSSSWDGDIVFAAEWLRPLSDAEWDQMIDNPWQIFEPQRVIVGVAITPIGVVITDVANSGETPGAGSETWDDGSTGNVITGTGFL